MENEKHDIKTFLFLDLEATGIPDYEFNRTKITEIAMVACSKEHILKTDRNLIPRVLHKLTLCVQPQKMIHPEATEITGLDNFMLEHENKFDTNIAQLMSLFFRRLQQPICLVAHNGAKFDFPLLKKELEKVTEVGFVSFSFFQLPSLIK